MKLVQNLSWMMFAELLSRLSRFVTLFVLAAYFSNSDYGLAMLALVIHEIMRVFTRLGTGAKIIQCKDHELPTILQNAATLQWLVVIVISFTQIALADTLGRYYQQPLLAELLKIMALAHILYPIVTVRIFEQHRLNRMRYYGIASGLCIAFENLFIAALVFCNVDVFAVAYAKVAAAVIWVLLFWKLPTQLVGYYWEWSVQKSLFLFSMKTLVSELGKTLRFQFDSLFAARVLSPEIFGLYSFAKSAGLGISQSFSTAYLSSLYPHLCDKIRLGELKQAKNSIRKFTFLVVGLFICQALAAQFYVEWLFDKRWEDSINLVSLLCLVAIPTLLIDQFSLIFRAQNQAMMEMKITLACTTLLIAILMIVKPDSVYDIAFTLIGTSLLWCALLFTKTAATNSQTLLRAQTI